MLIIKNGLNSWCGMGREATLFLTNHGVKVVGTDGWSWDTPFISTKEKYLNTGDPSIIWEDHFAGSVNPYCQIEKINNHHLLPDSGFIVISLPIKVNKFSAG
ncbi:cyclase family protein [Rahnella variigena]|uniref:cyclase family protein n=1 Tax=Rahnella variigena TaxID=574964 RepID=UPI002712122C|nr:MULTISPECIES: cyclase family protein [Rahnella]